MDTHTAAQLVVYGLAGISVTGILGIWVWAAHRARKDARRDNMSMLTEHLKKRLEKDRPMTTITLRIPVDVVESMKDIAPKKGLSGYQTLLKSYISNGLRRDEAIYTANATARLVEVLKRRGVSAELLDDAARESEAA